MIKTREKKGAVAFAVLVCLVVTTTIVLGAVASSLRHRRQLQKEIQLEQTRLLLDAGIDKAIAEVESDPKYEGQTLDQIDAIGKYKNAIIKIKKLDSTENVQFQIVAKLSAKENSGRSETMQRSKTITLKKN